MNISECRSCGARIVWMKTQLGKNIPIDAEAIDEATQDYTEDGKPQFMYEEHKDAVHFKTCPQADQWRNNQ